MSAPSPQIAARYLEAALRVTRLSVSKADRALYERLRDKLLSIRSNIAVSAAAAASVATAGGGGGGGALLDATGAGAGSATGAAPPAEGGCGDAPGGDAMRGVV